MPTPKPLDPLFTLGDALLQLAPHNVLAKGGISISPVMARQPTLYEEMNRPVQPPAARSAPVPSTPAPKTPTVFDAGDGILRLAPHNMLFTLLSGGQAPPGVPAAAPPGVSPPFGSFGVASVPAGMSLKQYASASGKMSGIRPVCQSCSRVRVPKW